MWENIAPSHIMANIPLALLLSLDNPLQSLDSVVSIFASETFMSNSKWSNITIIGVTVFLYTSKLPGSSNFKLCSHFLDILTNSAKLTEAPDLSNISSEYYEFTNVFSKTKAEVLASHCPYNLKINLKEGAQPLIGSIYSFLASKQEAFKEFIEKNFNMNFIQSTSFLHSVLVLLVKKKYSSLYLCVNFCSLNCISKKDRYPLLLISNLLDLPYKD